MRTRLEAMREERGVVLVLVVFVMAMLSLMAVALIDTVKGEVKRSGQAVTSQAAFQAAEAGIADYVGQDGRRPPLLRPPGSPRRGHEA